MKGDTLVKVSREPLVCIRVPNVSVYVTAMLMLLIYLDLTRRYVQLMHLSAPSSGSLEHHRACIPIEVADRLIMGQHVLGDVARMVH